MILTLSILRWLLVIIAGISALFLALMGYVATGFAGIMVGASLLFCLPVLLLVIFRPKWGTYAVIVQYLFCALAMRMISLSPRFEFDPLASGIGKILIIFSSAALLSCGC